uniref:Uncharacterized protein n=1 Tax=Ulva torta TaxID=932731 RepID=A0A7R6NFN1_9CHLO|nr:hypothetical protein JXY92_mgp30 [Ulva torta]AZP40267.1 hypothetical protein [Ulva torta]
MALLLTAIQSPIVAYCAGAEPLTNTAEASSELSTEGGSTDLFGNTNKPGVNSKVVGEGMVVSKAAKAAKPAADSAANEAKDIGARYYDKGKDAVAGAAVAGTVAGGCIACPNLRN